MRTLLTKGTYQKIQGYMNFQERKRHNLEKLSNGFSRKLELKYLVREWIHRSDPQQKMR